MARKIILKENGLSGTSNTPTGYRYIGYNGVQFSEQVGLTLSGISGAGGVQSLSEVLATGNTMSGNIIVSDFINISTVNNSIGMSESTDIIALSAGNNITLNAGNAVQVTFGLIGIFGLQTFTDNTAAAAGGIPTNYLYKTPTGQVMIRY